MITWWIMLLTSIFNADWYHRSSQDFLIGYAFVGGFEFLIEVAIIAKILNGG